MSFPSKATPEFWDLYSALPREVKKAARKAFHLWSNTPFHPSLHFKKVGNSKWSARVGANYRSVGRFRGGCFVWYQLVAAATRLADSAVDWFSRRLR
jgi:hypothetical protein